jgi:hypothetical protein
MVSIASPARNLGIDLKLAAGRRVSKSFSAQQRSLKFGPILLAATIVLLPLQDHVPSVAGFSLMYVVFGVILFYVFFNRMEDLFRVSRHPVFIAAYVFLCVGLVMESAHTNSDYGELVRYFYMFGGAMLVASLSTRQDALRAGLYGYLIASLWLAVLLFSTSYSALAGSSATDFEEATRVRASVFSDQSLRVNLNTMAFISSQGVVVALALMLTAKSRVRRLVLMALALFCFVASFIPMSRSGAVIGILSVALVMYKHKSHRLRTILAALVLGISMLVLVPDAVLSRLHYSSEVRDGKIEGRARVYKAAWENVPDYLVKGVGTGNYFREWANTHGLGYHGRVSGVHNSYFQVTIYWGLAGLLALCGIIFAAYRCLPRHNEDIALKLFLYGITLSLVLWMMATHNLYAKEFALGLGLLVGADLSHSSKSKRQRKSPRVLRSKPIIQTRDHDRLVSPCGV